MATNQLIPFANGAGANVETYANWSTLADVSTGFQSGLARSKYFNYILAQGGAAGYAIGKVVVDWLGQDATIDATTLGTNFEAALQSKFGGYLPLTGGTLTGTLKTTSYISQAADDSHLEIYGGSSTSSGAKLVLNGMNNSPYKGYFYLEAKAGNSLAGLDGRPDGHLLWNAREVFRSLNWGAVVDISRQTSGSISYTAPSSGFMFFEGRSAGWSGIAFVINSTQWTVSLPQSKESSVSQTIPLCQGDVVAVSFNGAGFVDAHLYFVPYAL